MQPTIAQEREDRALSFFKVNDRQSCFDPSGCTANQSSNARSLIYSVRKQDIREFYDYASLNGLEFIRR